MTFYYYKKIEDEKLKYEANIDANKLSEIYKKFFNQYSEKRNIRFISDKKITIKSTNDLIVTDYNVNKINTQYEISYTLYSCPKICQIIKGLLNEETFEENYDYLQSLLITNKQVQIDEIRKKIDRELRVFNILLDDEKRDNKIFQKIHIYCREMSNICNYDKELANQAQMVNEVIKVQKVNEKENLNSCFNHFLRQNNKSLTKKLTKN